ncbi:MAG: S41 family peptidase [Lachnospiraceae bacterium]|nr:S41 family peptidase [Lachnospiraceae bacterium]
MEEKKGFGKGLVIGIVGGALGMFIMAVAVIIISMNSLGKDIGDGTLFIEGAEGPNGGVMYELTETEDYVISKIGYIMAMIDSEFYFEYDKEKALDGIYYGVLDSLGDVYSTYYSKEEFDDLMETTQGVYYGIGVKVSQNFTTGIITVAKVFEGAPAFEAGMLPGDILVAVNDEDISGMDLNLVVAMIKSEEEGSKVKITVLRDGKYVDMDVERRKVEYPAVEYEMLDNNIGYLQLVEFDTVSVKQFEAALKDLNSQGMKGIVFDLRDNPGGTLDSVVGILDMILPECTIIYTEDKDGKVGSKYVSDADTILNVPAVVLVNGNSASAAEVFAGDVQDMGVATLVGTTTFGKGIVQQVYPIGDGTAVKLTQSSYFTSAGRNIHGDGIEPDVYVELDEALYGKAVIEKDEDNQLQKALEVLGDKIKAAQ